VPEPRALPKTQPLSATAPEPPAFGPETRSAGPRLPEPVAAEPVPRFVPSGVFRAHVRGFSPAAGAEPSGRRRVKRLLNAASYRDAALVKGVSGAVSLALGGDAGRPALLAICGATGGAGTTTVAVAVALGLAAQPRLRVLLVDADFRSPALLRLLGPVGSGEDFAAVLAGTCELGAALVWSEAEGLAVLPLAEAGRPPESPAVLRALADFRGLFDAVVFDAGSVAGPGGAAELAGAVGTAVLVVRAGATGAGQAREARRTLERSGARVAGAILTCAGPSAGRS
jgi:tyrosine-protein kinase Etk/Wzc